MRIRWMVAAALPLVVGVAGEARQAAAPPASGDFFEARIRPLLAANCYDCHTDQRMGGLRLDSREALDDVSALVEWVRAGAVWSAAPARSASNAAPAATPAAAAAPAAPAYVIKPEQRAFWSFQPLRKPAPPRVAHESWPKTDIDRFVLAGLEQNGLAPVGPADKRTLIRRATLDLTGLPPTVEEIEAFERDDSPNAFASVVDRLLDSPQYGETWGRMWLDVARYG
ncbi:MAG: hypothetical protein DMF93_02165, partial [Acidobacteria bacterium]